MIVASYSVRIVSPFQLGLQDIVHDTLEIAWVGYGRLGAIIEGSHRLLDATHFDVVTPRTRHSSWSLEQEVESHTLHLFADRARVRLASGTYPLEGAIRAILRGFPAPTAPRAEVERAARALLAELEALTAPIEVSLDERLLRVVWSLASEATAPVTLDELARRAHMSRHHFARAFRRALGVSPMAYVRRLRVERAALLLRSTDRSVAEIALAAGFSSAGRLSEAFRAQFGATPSGWREEQRAEHIEQSSR